MTPFSASDAALEGFNLIRRRWRVVLGWAAFNLLALVMVAVLTAILTLVAQATGGQAEVAAGLVAGLGALFSQAILAAGVFRLELRPEEPAFLHLRLGGAELRLIVVWLVTLTGGWVVWWVAAMLCHALHISGVWAGLLSAAASTWLGLRFLLTAPVSFVERRVDFPRSWRLTRGRVGALLGMTALSLSLIGLLLLAVLVAAALIAAGSAGFEGLTALFGGFDALQHHSRLYLLGFVVEIVLIPVLWSLAMAPLAAAYRVFAQDAPATAQDGSASNTTAHPDESRDPS